MSLTSDVLILAVDGVEKEKAIETEEKEEG